MYNNKSASRYYSLMKNALEREFIYKLRFITPSPLFYREGKYLSVMTVCLSVPRNFWFNTHRFVLKIQVFCDVTRVEW